MVAIPSVFVMSIAALLGTGVPISSNIATVAEAAPENKAISNPYLVLGYNDLGMHCMNQRFSEICILPPYNTLRAQVIDRRGEDPKIVTSGVQVKYSIPGNTTSTNKTDFWTFSKPLFGKQLAPNIGLTGNGLTGSMKPTGQNDWSATGIPVTPLTDAMKEDPYQLSKIDVTFGNLKLASTVAVIPVSWEIRCDLCHNTKGISVETDILRKHDKLHNTKLEASKPVLCASCHADTALGTKGVTGVKSMSAAMHGSHASRMAALTTVSNKCYACHPGVTNNCQRDVHYSKGIFCTQCHGDMAAVASTNRRPWVDEPTCGSCHQKRKPNFQFEERGKLFKDSRGHHGIHCSACHGPQHATGPAVDPADNAQAIQQQGFGGTIKKCTVCHREQPDEPFTHRLDDSDRQIAKRDQRSPLGTYVITGTQTRGSGKSRQNFAFTGSCTVTSVSVSMNLRFSDGLKARLDIPLASDIPTRVASTTVWEKSPSGQKGTASFTFTKTESGCQISAATKDGSFSMTGAK